MTVNEIRKAIKKQKHRSAWMRGVQLYALEMLDDIDKDATLTRENYKALILNGASDWAEYSEGGCALVYDYDIAERLCTPSALRRTKNGNRNPNSQDTWTDYQTKALRRASILIRHLLY